MLSCGDGNLRERKIYAAEFEHLHATLLEWQGTDAHLILEGVTKEEKERIQIQPQVRKIGVADVIGEVKIQN